jgi:tripartite-type tricarboxylate transporter receptor subunit TctC
MNESDMVTTLNQLTRVLALCVAAVAASLGPTTIAMAQAYPSRAVTLVVPFVAGGGTDSIARDFAKLMADQLGQAVVVDNRGGAGGAVGAEMVARAKPDGHTLLFATSTFVTHAAITPRLSYDILKDFAPVAMLGRGPLLLVASRQSGARTLSELIALGKAKPEGLNYCSAGEGSINHLAGELLRQKTGLAMTHVPFKGSGPATLELLAGRVDLFVATVPTILQHVQAGKLPVLAVTGAKRSPLFPDVPTMAQAGLSGFEVTTWWGVLAPAQTPLAVIDRLNQVIHEAAASPAIQGRLQREGAEPLQMTPVAFGKVLAQELTSWHSIAANTQLLQR